MGALCGSVCVLCGGGVCVCVWLWHSSLVHCQHCCTPGCRDAITQCFIVLQAALSAAVQERDVADAALSDAREQNEEMKEVCISAGM